MESQRVDWFLGTALAVCTCGWRFLAGDRAEAWQAAASHADHSHRGDNSATASTMASRARASK